MSERIEQIESLIGQWRRREGPDFTAEELLSIKDYVRRRTEDLLLATELDPSSDLVFLSTEIVSALGGSLSSAKRDILEQIVRDSASMVLEDEEPGDVTELLWQWLGSGGDSGKVVEESLFRAIEVELRKRAFRVFNKPQFRSLHYKLQPAELVSELYLKLVSAKIPRLPENRRQFYGLVDKALERILLDIRKANFRLKRPQSHLGQPLSGVEIAGRPGEDALTVLLDEEQELLMRGLLLQLPVDQAEVFKLRVLFQVSVTEVAKMTGTSEATVKRKTKLAIEGLKRLQLAEGTTPKT
jgi:RNA polymerase sigma factor (sigma-70 family)